MKTNKILLAAIAGVVSLGVCASSLAANYTIIANNKTEDMFTLKKNLSSVGTLDSKEKLKKFEFDNGDTVLFISDNVPRFTLKYNADNKEPKCFDLFQGYNCSFTKAPGFDVYNLNIDKS